MSGANTPDAAPLEVNWDERGLAAAICQDAGTGQVLMLAWMNEEALRLTLEKGTVYFWSRSRRELWHKGETSGNFLRLVSARVSIDSCTPRKQVGGPQQTRLLRHRRSRRTPP